MDIDIYSASIIESLDNDKWYSITGGLITNEYGTVVFEVSDRYLITDYCTKDGDMFVGVKNNYDNYKIISISLNGKEEIIEALQLDGKQIINSGKTIYAYSNSTLEKYTFTNNKLVLQSTIKLNGVDKNRISSTIDSNRDFWYTAKEDDGVYLYKIKNDTPVKMYKVNEGFISTRLVIANESNISISSYEMGNNEKNIVIQNELNSWKQVDGKWYFCDINGNRCTGWNYIDDIWYYFNDNGVMQKGWINDNGIWYYLNNSGAMVTGWLNDNGTWYYLNDLGSMITGWQQIDGTWYYFDNSGIMETGWLKLGGTWYYINEYGSMQTGWLQVGSAWYYLYDSGAMATNTSIDGGDIDWSGVAAPQ